MRRWVATAAAIAAAVGVLYAATLSGAASTCEACVRYEGREACRAATGKDREEAERAAIATACALVAKGVTASIRCQNLAPLSLRCEAR